MTSFYKILPLTSLLVILAGCGSGNSSEITNPTIALVPPVSSVIAAGSTLQFQAKVSGTSNTAVLWFVNNIPGGNSTVGTITPQGLYTAPNIPTSNGSVLISVSPQAFPVISSSIIIGITFANVSLSGNYVFALKGTQAGSPLATAGSFTANGDGTLNGIEDINGPSGISIALTFSGSYLINANGQGLATFTSAKGSTSLEFTLNTQGQAVIMSTDSGTVASGSFYPQLSNALTLTSLNAPFVFSLTGSDTLGNLVNTIGIFVTDGSNTFSYAEEDLNTGVTTANQAFTGTYSLGNNGPGTGKATFTDSMGTRTYDFYIISATQLQFIEVDNSGFLSGTVFEQQSVVDTTVLLGSYVYYTSGGIGSSAYGVAGGFATNTTSAGNINAGTNDINEIGTLASNPTLTGSFTTGAYGRGTITLTGTNGATNYTYYFISPNAAFLITSDPAINASGQLFSQTGGFITANLLGYYTLTQSSPANSSQPSSAVGLLTLNGNGALAGFMNTNTNGTVSGQQTVTGTDIVTTFTSTTSTRGLANLTTSGGTSTDYVFYPISNNAVIMLTSGYPAVATLVSQY